MLIKVILVISMHAFKHGGLDHIEFNNMSQCLAAKAALEAVSENTAFGWGRYRCTCIEVRE